MDRLPGAEAVAAGGYSVDPQGPPALIAEAAFGVSLISLAFSGIALWRAWRGERLQRGRLEVAFARAVNLYEGGRVGVDVAFKNIGRDAVTILAIGLEHWLSDRPDGEPSTIAMHSCSHHVVAGGHHGLLEAIEIAPADQRRIIDGDAQLCIGVRAHYADALGGQSGVWAFTNVIGATPMSDRLSRLPTIPRFLRQPVER